jgi:lysophospholipase L1-like esterase
MKTSTPKSYPWIAVLALALMLSACAQSATHGIPSNRHTTSATPVKQPTQSSLLSKPVTYVALGASDAVGVGTNAPGSQGYVPLVAAHLPKGSRLINLGISGIRLHEALSKEMPLALSTSPDLVTIWLVANDFIDGVTYNDYMHDLNTLLQQLHTGTHAYIVMANLPDLTLLPAFARQTPSQKAQTRAEIEQWNAGIAQAAARYDTTLVDLFSLGSQLTAHPEYISGDGFHPSPSGYAQLANYFWLAIRG